MRYTRHIKTRTTSLGRIETGLCEQGSVITEAVQALLKQDGDEVRLATVDEDTQLFALEVIWKGSYFLHVHRTGLEISGLLEKYEIPQEQLPFPTEAFKPSKLEDESKACALHYQGTASFAARLHFKKQETSA